MTRGRNTSYVSPTRDVSGRVPPSVDSPYTTTVVEVG